MAVQTSELLLRLRDGLSAPARIAEKALQGLGKAITSSITNKSGVGFGAASAAMRRDALEIKRSVASVEHSTHALGTALAGLGIGHEFGEFMKAGADYRKELVALKNSGKTSSEIAASMKAAAGIATALPTQTFADSIKIINETTAAYGDLQHALENLKFNSKFESNMKAVLGEHADPHMLQNMVRALEIRGTAFNPEKYQEEAGRLGKAFAFSRGAVNPENFYDFAKNANPDIKGFSTEFLTEVVPSLIQTFSAPGAGTGIKAFEKVWRGGLTDKSQAAEWVRVGLVSAKAVQDNKGQSPGWKSGAAAFSQLARENPLEAMTKLLEKLQKIGVDITDPNKLGPELDKLFKNGKARAMAYELGQAVTRQALQKDARLIRGSASMDEQYENNKDNLDKAKEAIKAAFENLMASMSGPLVTSAAHGLWNLAIGVQKLAVVLHDHPMLGGAFGLAASVGAATAGVLVLRSGLSLLGLTGLRPIAALQGAMLGLRTAAIGTAAMMGRGFLTLLNPLALVRGAVFGIGVVIRGIVYASGIGALIAAGALIYQNWDNIRVAFEAFRGAFMRAIGPVRPILQPILTDIGRLWDLVSGLIQPTGDMGAKWAQVGMQIGTVLGKDLVPWAGSIRAVWDAVKGMGDAWNAAVAIITSDDPIGRAVTALAPRFNAMVRDMGAAIVGYDWRGAWDSLRAQADPILTRFFTGWVDYARQGAASFMSYDWSGLAKTVADALGTALSTDPAILGTAFVNLAKAGWDAFIGYDWIGLGGKIVEAIIQGIEGMAGALGDKLKGMIPSWVPGFSHTSFEGGGGEGGFTNAAYVTYESDGGTSAAASVRHATGRNTRAGGGARLIDRAGSNPYVGGFPSGNFVAPGSEATTAGMRQNNLGNIGWFRGMHAGVNGLIGPSNARDVDHSIARYATQEDGIRAAAALALRKYRSGMLDTARLIAGKSGWTPGALGPGASVNVARAMGLSNRDDLHLTDENRMAAFLRGLALQEHGQKAGSWYTEDRIRAALHHGAIAQKTAPEAREASPEPVQPRYPTSVPMITARIGERAGARQQMAMASRTVHITNHFHDMGDHDPDEIAGKVAQTFHEHGHAGAAGNFADVG